MYYIKKIIFIFGLMYSISIFAFFDNNAVGAKSIGAGNCSVMIENSANALLINPAIPIDNSRLAFEGIYNKKDVIDNFYDFTGTISYHISDQLQIFFGGRQKILQDILSIGLYSAGINYPFIGDIYLGVRLDYYLLSPAGILEDANDAVLNRKTGISSGVGVYYRAFDYLKIGLSFNGENIKNAKKIVKENANIGFFFSPAYQTSLYFQVNVAPDNANQMGFNSLINIGIEKQLGKYFSIRAGYPQKTTFSLGGSFSYNIISIDYAALFSWTLGVEHFIGIRVSL